MANLPAYMLIRQYVMEMVFTHQNTRLPIMSERELSRKFDVSRTTIRMALEDLVKDGILISKPRSGLFLSPDYDLPTSFRYPKILLIHGDGRYVYMGGFLLRLNSMLYSHLQNRQYRLTPVNLTTSDPAKELSFYSAAGILWVQAPGAMRNTLKECRKFCHVQELFGYNHEAENSICVDYFKAGKTAAGWFLEQGIKTPLLLGSSNNELRRPFFEGWFQTMKEAVSEYDESYIIPSSYTRKEILADIFQKKHPEGIFCYGSEYSETVGLTDGCRILCDDAPYVEIPELRIPDAIIKLAPESLTIMALENLFTQITSSATGTDSILYTPEIITDKRISTIRKRAAHT